MRPCRASSRSSAFLINILRQTRQHQGETVRLFSHRIRAAFNALTSWQATLKVHVEDETTLREHFINAVNCQMLSLYLAEKIASNPALTFLDVREIAIRRARDEDSTATVGTSAVAAAPRQASPTEARLDCLERMMGDQATTVTDLANSVKMLLERQLHTPTSESHNRRNLRQYNRKCICYRSDVSDLVTLLLTVRLRQHRLRETFSLLYITISQWVTTTKRDE